MVLITPVKYVTAVSVLSTEDIIAENVEESYVIHAVKLEYEFQNLEWGTKLQFECVVHAELPLQTRCFIEPSPDITSDHNCLVTQYNIPL